MCKLIWKRLLCGALALQLCCGPITQVFAAENSGTGPGWGSSTGAGTQESWPPGNDVKEETTDGVQTNAGPTEEETTQTDTTQENTLQPDGPETETAGPQTTAADSTEETTDDASHLPGTEMTDGPTAPETTTPDTPESGTETDNVVKDPPADEPPEDPAGTAGDASSEDDPQTEDGQAGQVTLFDAWASGDPFWDAYVNSGYVGLVAESSTSSAPKYALEGNVVDYFDLLLGPYGFDGNSTEQIDIYERDVFPEPESNIANDLKDYNSTTLGRVPNRQFKGWAVYQGEGLESIWTSLGVGDIYGQVGYFFIYDNFLDFSNDFRAVGAYTPGDGEKVYQLPEEIIDLTQLNVSELRCFLPVIGVWVLSDNASATKLAMTGGSEEIKLFTQQDGTFTNVVLDGESGAPSNGETYYARVPAGQDSVTIHVTTYEPGLIDVGPDVSAAVSFGGRNNSSEGITVERGVENAPIERMGKYIPQNSADTPARGLATIEVPLEPSQAAKGDSYVYNEIKVTVTAPDGETTETYTIMVQRMNDPQMEKDPGNTPAGMIARDTVLNEAAKEKAQTVFESGLQFDTATGPRGVENQFGSIYYGKYSAQAWTGENIDLDKTAVVVYQNSCAILPGFTLYDGEGKIVDITSGTPVQATLKLQTAETLSTDVIMGTVPTSELTVPLTQGSNGEAVLDLRGVNAVPGIYTIEYEYSYQYGGTLAPDPDEEAKIYSSTDTTVFSDPNNAAGFKRTLVVLPIPGDVDMDGAATTADGLALKGLLLNGLLGLSTDVAKLFAYRVCDVDGDGEVIEIDDAVGGMNSLVWGYTPAVKREKSSDYFYLPLPGGVEPEQKSLTVTETPDPGKAHLTVEYLGTGSASGPFDGDAELQAGDVFWMGVKLENVSAIPLEGSVTSFTFNIAYDSKYIAPADGWYPAVMTANSGMWDGYYLNAMGSSSDYISHYAKAACSLSSGSGVKEVRVNWLIKDSETTLKDGYVVKLPFKLIRHPLTTEKTLIEPSLGMSQFVVTTENNVAVWSMQDASGNPSGATLPGGNINLQAYIEYLGTDGVKLGEVTAIPLKNEQRSDDGICYYGDPFSNTATIGRTMEDPSQLPKGLRYSQTGGITGTPEEVGTFKFIIGEAVYSIEVRKSPLEIAVTAKEKYYGETNPTATFTYDKTQIKAIDYADKQAQTGTGTMADLKALDLAGYVEPKMEYTLTAEEGALTDTTNRVKQGEPANAEGETYHVVIGGASATNYEITYTVAGSDTPSETMGSNTFTVLKRPIFIQQITKNPAASIFATDAQPLVAGQEGKYPSGGQGKDFTVSLPELKDGCYNGLPLSGSAVYGTDSLELTYSVYFQPDSASPPYYTTSGLRAVTIRDLKVVATDVVTTNYDILNSVDPQHGMLPVDPTAQGQVNSQIITELTLTNLPLSETTESQQADGQNVKMTFTHGDVLDLTGLWVDLKLNTSDTVIHSKYDEANFARYGIEVKWLKYGEDGKIEDSVPAEDRQFISRELDGYYLGVVAESYDDTMRPVTFTDRSDNPAAVNKGTITLTVEAQERYYGEKNPTPVITYTGMKEAGMESGKTTDWNESNMPGYKGLTVKFVKGLTGNAEDVTTNSDANLSGENYYVTISGAQSDNYEFRYVTGDGAAANQTRGWATLKVLPRPIMVTAFQGTVASIYSNATVTELKGQTATAADFVVTGLTTGQKYFSQNGFDGTEYKIEENTAGALESQAAACNGDKLAFTYTARYVRDNEISSPYFDLKGLAQDERTVEIRDIELTTECARNYVLAFSCRSYAMYGNPGSAAGSPDEHEYQTTGVVKLKKITGIELTGAEPRLSYVHGDILRLDAIVTGDNALKAILTYSDGTKSDPIAYASLGNGKTTFSEANIKITWNTADGTEVPYGQELIAAVHNGAKLVVSAQSHSEHERVTAEKTLTVTVARKELTLTAKDQDRYYGEENGTYEFTFDVSKLAPSDQKLLQEKKLAAGGSAAGLNTQADSAALKAINEDYESVTPYVGPVFGTQATKTSGALSSGYPLTLADGETTAGMANYTFKYEGGTIRIYRRPIVVTKVVADPVYTIALDDEAVSFSGVPVSTDGFTASLPQQGITYTAVTKPGEIWPDGLALADRNAKAVLDGDSVSLTVTVLFPSRADRVTTETTASCDVTVSNVTQTTNLDNYILLFKSTNTNRTPDSSNQAKGRLEARSVESLLSVNDLRLQYTYGDGLDLSSLKFSVQYSAQGGEKPVPVIMSAEALGALLQLHYWDPKDPVPTDQEKLAEIFSDTETLATAGDHLTIAGYGPDSLTHQGKRLLAIVETRKDSGQYVTILSDPIVISPKELTYTLSAEDKIYDGTRAATGKLELNNVLTGDEVGIDTSKIEFKFVDANVAYVTAPTLGNYGEIAPITVEVRNITLTGAQAANYTINSSVLQGEKPTVVGRPTAPQAKILKASRSAAPAVEPMLSVDNQTNAVTVSVGSKTAVSLGDRNDAHNSETRFEYALEYLDQNGQSVLWNGGYTTGSRFGGETASLDGTETAGALPRDTWFRAIVRLAETWNYEASQGTCSVEGDLAELIEDAQAAIQTAPDKEAEGPASRAPAALAKTYRYRLTLASAEKVKDQDGKDSYVSALEAVWFNDYQEYQRQEELATAVNSPKSSLYHGYYWDPQESKSLSFPLDLTKPITVTLPGGDDPVQVNANDNLLIYVAKVPKAASGAVQPRSVSITPEEVWGQVGGQPVQLTAEISPSYAAPKTVTWSSSDETVVMVDEEGVLTFIGAGIAVVTATTRNGKQASITVTVAPTSALGGGMINVAYWGSFMSVDAGGYFRPEEGMTRGEMAIMMARLFQTPKSGTPGAPMTFIDVPAGTECAQAVALLSAWGVVDGIGGGYYEPDRLATRAEMAAVVSRMLQLRLVDTRGQQHAFVDGSEENTWAYAELDALARVGVVEGTVSGNFEPNRAITRAETATLIWRLLTTRVDIQAEGLVVPRDVTADHWAYEMILRAVNSAAMPLEER